MRFPLFIAWRYLFSRKGHNAINIVSGVSAAAVGVVAAAMVCVMSVMNGFGHLVEGMFSAFDPELKIVSAEGKTLRIDAPEVQQALSLPFIDAVSEQVSETALVIYNQHQTPATLLGVDDQFAAITHIDSLINEGYYSVYDGRFERAVVGQGLAVLLGINARFTGGMQLYAPRRTERVNMLRPDENFQSASVFIAGTFAVGQVSYDDKVMLVSLPLARRLFEYDSLTVTSLNLSIAPASRRQFARYQRQIERTLGDHYRVLDRYEQQQDFFRILRIEKLLTTLLMIFILLIACFNIIGSLSMLMLDKQQDTEILRHLGADDSIIKRIFLLEGWLICLLGATIGIVTGVVLCMLQQHFGFIKLGSGIEYVVSAYPVVVVWTDVLWVALIVIVMGALTAWYPTRMIRPRMAALWIPILLLPMAGCKHKPTPSPRPTPHTYEMTLGIEERYGQHYDSVPRHVVALDLYTEGLSLDSLRLIHGTGHNLYLSDIFVNADSLTEGVYHSDTTCADHTFLPGRDFEGNPSGIYLLSIQDDAVSAIRVIREGSFTLSRLGQQVIIDGIFVDAANADTTLIHFNDTLSILRP